MAAGIGDEDLFLQTQLQNLGNNHGAFTKLSNELDKFDDTAKFFLRDDSCHLITKSAAFNMTEVVKSQGGSYPS